MKEKFSAATTAVEQEILAEEPPVDFVATVQEHFAKVGLDTAHEAIRVLAGLMLSN